MDDLGALAQGFGIRPQGKNAPMAASRVPASGGGAGAFDLGSGSARSYASWDRSRSSWSSEGVGIPERRSTAPDIDDVFGGGGSGRFSNPAETASSHGRGRSASSPTPPDSDPFFGIDGFNHSSGPQMTSASSMPVYDKPLYDDDIFEGVPGVKSSFSSSSANFDVFDSIASGSSSAPTPPPYADDFLENLGRSAQDPKSTDDERSGVGKGNDAVDDLLPGFDGSSPPRKRDSPEPNRKRSSFSTASTTANETDPFVGLESASTSSYPSSVFSGPLEPIGRPGATKVDASSANEGIFDDASLLDGVTKPIPSFATETNANKRENSSIHDVQNMNPGHHSFVKETNQRSTDAFENILPNMQYPKPSDPQKSVQRNYSSNIYEFNNLAGQSPKFHDHMDVADDIWLTVAEIPLFTQPTNAPPPSRPPPPLVIKQSSFGTVSKQSENIYIRQSTQSDPYSRGLGRKPDVSPIDELEDFASGRSQNYVHGRRDTFINEEETETTSAAAAYAAAMKEAMDQAEAKFKQAKEVRERERDTKSFKNRESFYVERDDEANLDGHGTEDQEKHERPNREEELKLQEEKEKEQKRLEREREQELERQRARQAVERATREARERAAAEARMKAEKAAIEKAALDARLRAERAAVQRAATEARERAAAEARQRAEKEAAERAAAEAKERAAAEAREKAAREKAAVERVAAEARKRAERAAVERAAAEARERLAEAREKAAAEARQKAASAAREKQHKPDDDLESFFGRANSAPKQRVSETFSDTQPQRTTSGSSSNIKKASSTTNIVDDLTSIFGGTPSSGEFQELEGEGEERRRARLERHQRAIERANKALAEKKERDLQNQREQQERNRIGETLDFEIKRWSAGKEGNLRALLSTLQYVLWPECGWQPVSLTDLITGAAVKKVYRKATLCIHPDKVQQKGATLQQKYIAEKVFDLLKEAWNKFNSEELF